jgi:hypothetical protein
MPCLLFTWHTYGSWLPDRVEGYVHWDRGLQASNPKLAQRYREQQKDSAVEFSDEQQQLLIGELQRSAELATFRLHYVAFEPTHVHIVVSWCDSRTYKQLRRSIRRSISAALNRHGGERSWLSRGESARHVKDQAHFDYLTRRYLPDHKGWKWCERRGMWR